MRRHGDRGAETVATRPLLARRMARSCARSMDLARMRESRGTGMSEGLDRTMVRWLRFAGCVLVVAVLYWAQAVLVPVALALLITFVLTPPVIVLQRWIGRVPAVLTVVALVFTV